MKRTNIGTVPFEGHTVCRATARDLAPTEEEELRLMSAVQISTHPSDAAPKAHDLSFAALRTATRADRGTALAARAAGGILIAMTVVLLVAGVATAVLR